MSMSGTKGMRLSLHRPSYQDKDKDKDKDKDMDMDISDSNVMTSNSANNSHGDGKQVDVEK